jgi:ribosomal protein L37E
MATKLKKKHHHGTCRRCGKSNVMIDEKCLCNKCFPIVLRNANRVGRTYLDVEYLDRREWSENRFLRSGIIDFDAECSLGGFPDDDSWFPPEEEHYQKFMHIIYLF